MYLQCLTPWFISPTLTTPMLPVHCCAELSLSYTHTHTSPLRHSPVVWSTTSRQLFLLSCHIGHDVRALLCVIGWRLIESSVCGRLWFFVPQSLVVMDEMVNCSVTSQPTAEHLRLSCHHSVKMCRASVTAAARQWNWYWSDTQFTWAELTQRLLAPDTGDQSGHRGKTVQGSFLRFGKVSYRGLPERLEPSLQTV